MASTSYEVDESEWFQSLDELATKPKLFVLVKWSFGNLFSSVSLLRANGRKISAVLHPGSSEDLSRLLLNATIPDAGAQFVRKIDQNGDTVLACFHDGSHLAFADSIGALAFPNSELLIQ